MLLDSVDLIDRTILVRYVHEQLGRITESSVFPMTMHYIYETNSSPLQRQFHYYYVNISLLNEDG